MKNRVAQVKNVRQLADALGELSSRGPAVPGIGLLWGPSGAGKTTAVTYLAVRQKAVYLRANATWTPRSMLSALMRELEALPLASSADMVDFIAQKLKEEPRPLFIDEGDYLLGSKKLIETLRDIHDLTSVPLLLIGMADFRAQVTHRVQLAGRVSQWVQFAACDREDAGTLASELCEVQVEDALLDHLHTQTGGSMRGLVVGLSKIERFGRDRQLQTVTRAAWAKRQLTLAGE